MTTNITSLIEEGSRGTFNSNVSSFERTYRFISQHLLKWVEDHAITITIPSSETGPRIVLQDENHIYESDNILQLRGGRFIQFIICKFIQLTILHLFFLQYNY